MKPTLTVFDVRDEAQGYENCPQVKTQTLKTGELETKHFNISADADILLQQHSRAGGRWPRMSS